MMIIKDIKNEVIIHKYKSSDILIALFWEDNGIRYYLKKNEVFYKKEELDNNIKIAKWFTDVTGLTIQIQPIVLNPPHIKTSDFIIVDTKTKLELKTITVKNKNYNPNKNYINKALGNGYGQANHFIIDISNSALEINKAINDINLAMSYMNRRYVHRVYLKKDNTLIGVFERK